VVEKSNLNLEVSKPTDESYTEQPIEENIGIEEER